MALQRPAMSSSSPSLPHSTSASSTASAATPPLSPTTTTPSSSDQSLSSSSDSSTLSAPFQNLRIENGHPSERRKDLLRPVHEQTYEGQLPPTDDGMFEMLTRESPRSTPCGECSCFLLTYRRMHRLERKRKPGDRASSVLVRPEL